LKPSLEREKKRKKEECALFYIEKRKGRGEGTSRRKEHARVRENIFERERRRGFGTRKEKGFLKQARGLRFSRIAEKKKKDRRRKSLHFREGRESDTPDRAL